MGQSKQSHAIKTTGNVGIGTTNPQSRLHVSQAGGTGLTDPTEFHLTNSTPQGSVQMVLGEDISPGIDGFKIRYNSSSSGIRNGLEFIGFNNEIDYPVYMRIQRDNGNVGIGTTVPTRKLFVNGDAGGTTAWNNDSDIRLKKNITTISRALDKIRGLRGVRFEWKQTDGYPDGPQIGFIAQEAKEIVPELIDKKGEYYSIQYGPVTALLVEAIKDLKDEKDALEGKYEALKVKYESLEQRINRLEKQ